MFAFENWHSALEMKLYFQRFIHHIGGLPDFSALKFTKYNQYESLILPMKKYLEDAGVDFQFNTEVTNVIFEINDGKKVAKAIECKVNGVEKGIVLTENDLVFVTNGSCTEVTIYGDKSFTFILKTPPAAELIKKEVGVEKGSGQPNKVKVGTITRAQLTKIAAIKMPDLNCDSVDSAIAMMAGAARSMGITVKD